MPEETQIQVFEGLMLEPDEEAEFWVFYRRTAEGLFRKAFRICRGHEADAHDAHQETYLKVLEHWATVRGLRDGQRQAWLITTLTNEIRQLWRARHRSSETAPLEEAGDRPDAACELPDPDVGDEYRRVCTAIAKMNGRKGEVLILHCLAGYEIPEVADMLGISQSTVRHHLHQGRRKLFTELRTGREGRSGE